MKGQSNPGDRLIAVDSSEVVPLTEGNHRLERERFARHAEMWDTILGHLR